MKIRFLPFLLILLGMTVPAVAQTPDPPRFLLESVVVEGVQRDAVREIVAAESLLQPGREYSEQELREAVYRIKRLPFVMDAELSLRKGGAPGSYQLVITVEETRLFFYSADIGAAYDGDDRRYFRGEDRVDWGAGATVGGRWFVGSQGLVFGSLQGFDTVGPASAQVGYTRYNLFGRGGFASAALATDVSNESDSNSYLGSFALGVPIVGNHSLRADLNWYRSSDDFGGQSSTSESRNLELSWIYDTTDDPFFPTSGTRLTANAGYSEYENRSRGSFFSESFSADGYDLGISGRRHWALTGRQSVSAELSGAWGESDLFGGDGNSESWQTALELGHSMDLWGFEKTERIGDFRWENSVTFLSSDFDYGTFGRVATTDARLTTGLAFRNAWGVLRLSFTYVDNLQRDEDFRTLP